MGTFTEYDSAAPERRVARANSSPMKISPVTVEQALRAAFPGAALERPRTHLSCHAAVRRCDPDEVIAFEGEAAPGIGFVLSGAVLALALSPNGREVVVSTTRSPQQLHDLSWYDVGALPLTLRAGNDGAEIAVVSGAAVMDCLASHPAFRLALLGLAAIARRALIERLRELAFYEVRSRVARRLLEADAAGERVQIERLAVATATVPDVAGRAMRQLQREGMIALDRGVPRVVDRGALYVAANLSGRWRAVDETPFLHEDAS